MLELIKKNKEILVICVLYCIIYLLLFVLATGGDAIMVPDTPGYILPAKNFLVNAFFSRDGINAEFIRTPGYPLFLALIYMLGGNDTTVIIAQIILMVIKIYLYYRILIMLCTPKKLSLLGSLLLICYIPSYVYSFAIMTEPLFGFFLMLSLYFLILYKNKNNSWFFFAFSLSLNYALFIRPILMYFNMLVCLALLIAFIFKKIQFKCFTIFTLCFAVLFGGWSYRNYLHSGVFIFSTLPKIMLPEHEAPIVTAGSKYMINHDVQGYIEGATDYHEKLFLQEYPEVNEGNLNEAQIAILKGKYGSQFIRNNFSEYMKVNIVGFLKMMLKPGFGSGPLLSKFQQPIMQHIIKGLRLLGLACIVIIYLLYLAGLVTVLKKHNSLQIGIFLLCGYLAIPGAIYATERYRDPFFPLLLLSAVSNSGIIIHWLSEKFRIPVLKRIENYLLHEQRNNGNG
jgi:4-amino-4-deoxy-L-arabinose transferase-like glycosyltransferase